MLTLVLVALRIVIGAAQLQEEVRSMKERMRREFNHEHEAIQADMLRIEHEKIELEERLERANLMIEVVALAVTHGAMTESTFTGGTEAEQRAEDLARGRAGAVEASPSTSR